jgi:glycosyltransferase involved in cell wall biosynthesis
MSFISIITINFNDASGLKKTIESVVNQSFQDVEYIVIDGLSADNSVEVIEQYCEKIAYWISEKDSGIDMTSGEYLLFLNSGDVFTSNDILKEFVTHENFRGDIIYGDYKFENGKKNYPDKVTPYYFLKSSLPHQSTFFKNRVFDIMGKFDESYSISGDRAFYLKCMVSNQFMWQHIQYPVTLFNLDGVSNNLEHLKKKQAEDERLWKENLGVFYQDYRNFLLLEKEIKEIKKKTIKGILLRIVNKIKKVCGIL